MERAGRVAFAMLAYTPKGAPQSEPPKGKAAARNASDAKAQAAAAATPAPLSGGMGDRGREVAIDLDNMKPGDFKKLSKEDQNRLLGIE